MIVDDSFNYHSLSLTIMFAIKRSMIVQDSLSKSRHVLASLLRIFFDTEVIPSLTLNGKAVLFPVTSRVYFCPCGKTSLCAKLLVCDVICTVIRMKIKWFSLFSWETFCTSTRSANGNSDSGSQSLHTDKNVVFSAQAEYSYSVFCRF